jgi:hypothetical protein
VDDGPAALLGGGDGDALPSILPAAFLEDGCRHLGPRRQDRADGLGADHDGVADHVVHLVALQHGLGKGDLKAGFGHGGARLPEPHAHAVLGSSLDDRLELVADSVEDAHGRSGTKSQHARQVLGLLFWQRDQITRGQRLRSKEPRVHAEIIRLSSLLTI